MGADAFTPLDPPLSLLCPLLDPPAPQPRSLLPPLRPEVTTPAPRSEAFNSVINFWRNRTKAFGGSVEPQVQLHTHLDS